jgi:hypothetical protein
MKILQSLFQSQDSKYFIKTGFKVVTVPVLCTLLMVYSLWLYMEMNYSFFLANGFASGGEMKETFFDYLISATVDYLPWVGLFYVAVYFVGLFLSHLVLRPFDQAAKMCCNLSEGGIPNTQLDPMSARKLVNRSVVMLVEFLHLSEKGEQSNFAIPSQLDKIKKPETDGVFYLQYGSIVFILALVTSISCYFFMHHMHEAIIDGAMKLLKSNASIRTFLTSQSDMMENIVWTATALSMTLYAILAKGIISDVEGVSYGYLRDVRDIVSGNTSKRLRPRFSDPGKSAANKINEVLDLYYPVEEKSASDQPQNVLNFKPHVTSEVPPSFIEEFTTQEGEAIYRVVTSSGEVIEGLSYEQAAEIIRQAS